MDNVSHIMEKVEPKVKMQVWEDACGDSVEKEKMEVYISGKEDECADLYVNYNLCSSWERLARSLYRHHQVAAVAKVRSYLPPRGEPDLKCTIITILFNGYSEENYIIVVTYISVIEDNLHKYVHSHNYTHKVTHTHIHTQPCYSCLPVMLQFQCNAHIICQ